MKNMNLLKGGSPDIMRTNARSLKNSGKSELDAVKTSMKIGKAKKHPNRHKNLGNFLHKKGTAVPPLNQVVPLPAPQGPALPDNDGDE